MKSSLKQEIKHIKRHLGKAKNVVITSHHNPDGDAVGSMLGLYHILYSQGISAQMVLPNKFPSFLAWMPGAEQILFHSHHKDEVEQLLKDADTIFSLDYNGSPRLENLAQSFKQAEGVKILIDHHPHPGDEFKYLISETNVSSTAELVYETGIALFGQNAITPQAAMSIYVGIMTDTGSFSYGCSNPRTFEVVSNLVKLGIDIDLAQRMVYNTFSTNRMKLMGYALAHKMQVFPEHKAAFISLTQQELRDYEYQIGDTEGFVNLPLSIENIVFSALFIENTGFVKVSLRSRGSFPVNEICEKYYDGGGHRNAAGGKSYKNMQETETEFVDIINKHAKELNQ